jgi:hypothetical protein
MATIETGEAVEGAERSRDGSRVALGPTQKIGEIYAPRAGREVDDSAQATKAGTPLGLIQVGPERTPSVASGDHREHHAAAVPRRGFQVLETAHLPVYARAYAYKADGEVSEIMET